MQTIITARHCEIPDALRARAEEVVEKLGRVAHRPQRAEVVFDDDHQRKVVELLIHLPQGQTLVASAEATDFRTALDRAAEKLRHQAERSADRATRRASAS